VGSPSHLATLTFTGAGFTTNDDNGRAAGRERLELNNAFTNNATSTFGLGGIATATVTGNFANAGVLNVDAANFDGGGNLTITGTLSNTKTVQVGSPNANAGAANALTLGALTNVSGAGFAVVGSPSHLATLTFTGAGFTTND